MHGGGWREQLARRSAALPASERTRHLQELRVVRARRELSRPELYALTLSPEGYLAIERATEAAEDDVIGHYNPNAYRIPRWTSLSKAMCADLEHEINVLRRGQLTHS